MVQMTQALRQRTALLSRCLPFHFPAEKSTLYPASHSGVFARLAEWLALC